MKLEDLTAQAEHVQCVTDRLYKMVASARMLGHTWEEIGVSLGVSRQAACKRFGAAAKEAQKKAFDEAVEHVKPLIMESIARELNQRPSSVIDDVGGMGEVARAAFYSLVETGQISLIKGRASIG